jgi:D-serine deaminase-like pyridoxal phosphate-dependent protein
MNPEYVIHDASTIQSPGLVFYKDLIRANIARVIAIAGNPERLRPHAKTHKTREITRMELEAGITKHKCATIAEAEVLATAGALDIFIAYPIVGPNCRRIARLVKEYPQCRFAVAFDSRQPLQELSATLAGNSGTAVGVVLDLDAGMHRTGIPIGTAALELYALAGQLDNLRPAGLHVYDGHTNQESRSEREEAVRQNFGKVLEFRALLEKSGLPVPRIIAGGTPTFPVYAALDCPGLECSPGTCVLHDHGYGSRFRDVEGFIPAALLLTRVISRPGNNRISLDLGYKAVASDPPAGQRCSILDVPSAVCVMQHEEHLVVETPAANRFSPGDVVYAVPTHICPTVAMHRQAYIVENHRVTQTWDIVARDRFITV